MKQLGDLTDQLALERALRVEIVSFTPEEDWTDYGPYLGVPRSRNVFSVTVRNNDVVVVSGLKLTVEVSSGERSVGGTFSWKVNLFQVGEEREVKGELIVPADSLTDSAYVATLWCGDVVVDDLRLPLVV